MSDFFDKVSRSDVDDYSFRRLQLARHVQRTREGDQDVLVYNIQSQQACSVGIDVGTHLYSLILFRRELACSF